jgi:hypothetical protein
MRSLGNSRDTENKWGTRPPRALFSVPARKTWRASKRAMWRPVRWLRGAPVPGRSKFGLARRDSSFQSLFAFSCSCAPGRCTLHASPSEGAPIGNRPYRRLAAGRAPGLVVCRDGSLMAGLALRRACGLPIRDTADCQSNATSFSPQFLPFSSAGDVLNPREHLRLECPVSRRRILPLRGGEGRGEGERNLFPTELKSHPIQPFP